MSIGFNTNALPTHKPLTEEELHTRRLLREMGATGELATAELAELDLRFAYAGGPEHKDTRVSMSFCYYSELLEERIRAAREIAEALDVVRDLLRIIETERARSSGFARWNDWACVECVPDSDMLSDGFQCARHKAHALTGGKVSQV